MNKKMLALFIFIIILGVFLRLHRLTEAPPGVNRDEASIGITAYSLLKTGRDEYGRMYPISFQSFGDWKLPLYIYTTVPFVWILGLNEVAVRLPSAIFGVLTIVTTYLLVLEMFGGRGSTQIKTQNYAEKIALLSSFLLAISPWHLHLSRVESESNTAVFFVTLGTLLFLKSLKKRQWVIILSALCFALSYFTYAGNHVFTTLLVIALVFLYRKEIPRTKITVISSMLFLALSGFLFYHTLTEADKTKLSGISIFGDPSIIHAKIELPRNEHDNPRSWFARLGHNRLTFAFERIGQNYAKSFSPEFLFIKGGDNHAHNILNFGNMYLVEAPFLLLGFMYLLILLKGKEKKLMLWWFLTSPIAVSITKDAPHTNRMFMIFPILSIVVALGLYWAWVVFSKDKLFGKLGMLGIVFLFLLNLLIYMDRYYIHFPRDEVQGWGNGYKDLVKILDTSRNKTKQIIMNKPEYSPYAFLLFYQKYDPFLYQKQAVRYAPTEDGFVHVKGFARYEFREIDWGRDVLLSNNLLIDQTNQVPDHIKNRFKTFQVVLPNGQPQFTIVETR